MVNIENRYLKKNNEGSIFKMTFSIGLGIKTNRMMKQQLLKCLSNVHLALLALNS